MDKEQWEGGCCSTGRVRVNADRLRINNWRNVGGVKAEFGRCTGRVLAEQEWSADGGRETQE